MIRVLGLAVVLLAATMAQAATVEMKLNLDAAAGTWQVLATSSPASMISAVYANDNAGIAGFTINMKNISTATMAGPNGLDLTVGTTRGFTNKGVTFDAVTSQYEVFGGQNTTDPNTLIFGIGQSAGVLTGFPPAIPNTVWDKPVVLASGTYVAGQMAPMISSALANVFTAAGAVTAGAASVVIVPEPVTLTLLGVGALALIRRRR